MDFEPAAKRSRLENDSTAQTSHQPPSPSSFSRTTSELWFEDGNIIIVCGSTGFRIHKGLLAFKSVVFKDMLAVGDADSSCNETSEGCIVVRLPDDEADMVRLLEALYSPRKYFGKSKMTSGIMNSLFKLSTKYLFEELRADLIDLLAVEFPSDRAEYSSKCVVFEKMLDPIVAVEFGITYNIPAIVPVACYEVALQGLNELLDMTSLFTLPDGRPVELSRSALRTCILFLEKWPRVVEDTLDVDNSDLEDGASAVADNPEDCYECGGGRSLDYRRKRQAMERRYRLLESNIFGEAPDQRGCEACNYWWDHFDRCVKDTIWSKLPSLCGYGDWQTIIQVAP